MDILIREAQIEDCPSMMGLIRELAIFEKAENEVVVEMSDFVSNGFGEQPIWWAIVVEHQQQLVGMALYYVRYSTWKGPQMYLEDIIITASFRNQGIGKALMNKLIAVAKAKNFKSISWQVLDWNTKAIKFYKKYNTNFDESWVNARIDL